MTESIRGYSYINPDEQPLGNFQVVLSDPQVSDHLPATYQAVMNEAWSEQFNTIFTAEQIAETVDPHNPSLVESQKLKLQNGNQAGEPTYVHAQVGMTEAMPIAPYQFWYVAGIGKGTYVDSRPGWQRKLSSDVPQEDKLADVSNVFVRPAFLNPTSGVLLQGKGYGSAILRSLLDSFPVDMPTVAYDYEFNARLQPVLQGLGFMAVEERSVELFGTQVQQKQYRGPLSGELVEALEGKRPWLRERQPI